MHPSTAIKHTLKMLIYRHTGGAREIYIYIYWYIQYLFVRYVQYNKRSGMVGKRVSNIIFNNNMDSDNGVVVGDRSDPHLAHGGDGHFERTGFGHLVETDALLYQ